MDLPARSGDVLSQPTRAALFARLGELRRHATTEELAAHVGLHRNGVRVHLERLREAGLVARERHPQGRGRPRDMWTVAPGARPGAEAPTAYASLGRWLARAVPATGSSLRAVERTGRELGREIAGDAETSGEQRMAATLAALGFAPERELDAGRLTFRLGNCPYRDAVADNQPLVCTLHRGMTRGLLDAISPATRLTGFVPRDPHAAGCLIELRGELADEAAKHINRI